MGKGTLYGVGVGPGDPELVTLKAIRTIEACRVVVAPRARAGSSLALSIVRANVDLTCHEVVEVPFAMAGEDDASVVRSPMVGTFYAGPSPDEDPFVKVGQEVLTGQTLAIVEAMKMMNEITAPAPGVVTEVLAANGTQVEYDQPLFRISTSANA